MNRMFLLTSVLALGVIVSSNVVQAEEKDDKEPSIKDVMKTAHGEAGLKAKITKGVAAEEWDKVGTAAKDWIKQAKALSKATPTKGKAASWKKLTTAYEKNVKAVADAAEKKDGDAAKTALKKINTSCGGCHGAHKPPKE
jgi:cytochrome c556